MADRWSFTGRLSEAITLRGLTQEELAKVCGIQPSAISHFVSGNRKPNFDNIRKLAITLRVTTDFLLGLSASPTGSRPDEPILGCLQKLTHQNRSIAKAVVLAIYEQQKEPTNV